MTFTCPSCGTVNGCSDDMVALVVNCAHCQASLRVPGEDCAPRERAMRRLRWLRRHSCYRLLRQWLDALALGFGLFSGLLCLDGFHASPGSWLAVVGWSCLFAVLCSILFAVRQAAFTVIDIADSILHENHRPNQSGRHPGREHR